MAKSKKVKWSFFSRTDHFLPDFDLEQAVADGLDVGEQLEEIYRQPDPMAYQWPFKKRYIIGPSMPNKVRAKGVGIYKRRVARQAIMSPRTQLKCFDVTLTNLTLNATAQVTFLNTITSGSDINNRVGDKIKLKSLEVTIFMARTGNVGSGGGERLRIMLIYDSQPVPGSSPAIAQILEDTTGATDAHSMLNIDNRDRFKVIRDWRWAVPDSVIASGSSIPFTVWDTSNGGPRNNTHAYVNLKDLPTVYERGSTNIHTGALYIVGMGTTASGSESFTADFQTRVRYRDA